MKMTRSIRLLAKASGKKELSTGEKITVDLNYCYVNDGTGAEWVDLCDCSKKVFDSKGVVVVIDHQTPANFVKEAQLHHRMITFSRNNETEFSQTDGVGYELMRTRYLKGGEIIASQGEHCSYLGVAGAMVVPLTPEQMAEALVTGKAVTTVPETVLIELKGTLPYATEGKDAVMMLLARLGRGSLENCVVEYTGDLGENDKIAMCALISDAGARSAMFVDSPEGEYGRRFEMDLAGVCPCVAMPGDTFDVRPVTEVNNVSVNSVFVGGCLSGRIEDLRLFASLMDGKHCREEVRTTFCPVDRETFLQALDEGIVSTLMESGCQLINPGCGGCRTTAFGIVDERENLISAGGCNWPGCCGSRDANVYLTGVRAAASASLSGYLCVM